MKIQLKIYVFILNKGEIATMKAKSNTLGTSGIMITSYVSKFNRNRFVTSK